MKLWMKITIPSTIVGGLIIGISVPIAVIEHEKKWEVDISAYRSGYGTNVFNARQSQGQARPLDNMWVWGILNTDQQKAAVAKLWSLNDSSEVLAALKADNEKQFPNALVKFAYDILHIEKSNGSKVTIKMGGFAKDYDVNTIDPSVVLTDMIADGSGLPVTYVYDEASNQPVAVDAAQVAKAVAKAKTL